MVKWQHGSDGDHELLVFLSIIFHLLQGPESVMASRLLHRLKRSLFKNGEVLGPEPEVTGDGWEAELEGEEECVTERLGGKLCFDSGQEEGAEDEDEGSGQDSNSDILGESMEEGLSSTGVALPGLHVAAMALIVVSLMEPPPLLHRHQPLRGPQHSGHLEECAWRQRGEPLPHGQEGDGQPAVRGD